MRRLALPCLLILLTMAPLWAAGPTVVIPPGSVADDSRFPTSDEKAAMGDSATGSPPSASNLFVVNDDSRLPALVTPSALSAASQITCSKPTIYIAGSGGAVTLTDVAWIVAGTLNGQECRICGSHATNTVTAPDATGVRLAGDTGSVVFGDTKPCVDFVWTGAVWRQSGVTNLQQAANVSRLIDGLTSSVPLQLMDGTTGFHVYSSAGEPVLLGKCAGSDCPSSKLGPKLTVHNTTGAQTGPGVSPQTECHRYVDVAAALDNALFMALARAVIITGVWCNYEGSAPTLAATFTLEDGSGNAMTITGTNPTCAAPGTPATVAAVTAGNALTAREVLRFDTTNTPNPATDEYLLCVSYEVTD